MQGSVGGGARNSRLQVPHLVDEGLGQGFSWDPVTLFLSNFKGEGLREGTFLLWIWTPSTGEFSMNPLLPFLAPWQPPDTLDQCPSSLSLHQESLVGSDEDQSDPTGLQRASEETPFSPQ